MALALFMHRAIFGRNVVRTAILLPYGIITVVSAFAFQFAVSPGIGGFWHLTSPPLNNRYTSLFVIIITEVWKTTPFMSLLLLAGLATVPNDYVEAAKVDGANAWQRLRRVILPNMRAAVLVAVLFRTLDAVRIFDTVFIQTRGANNTADPLAAGLQPADQPAEPRPGLCGLGAAVHHRDRHRVHLRQGIPDRSRPGSRGSLMATIAATAGSRTAGRTRGNPARTGSKIQPLVDRRLDPDRALRDHPDPLDSLALAEVADRHHRRVDRPEPLLLGELRDDLQDRRLRPAAAQLDRHRDDLDAHRGGSSPPSPRTPLPG